MSPARKKENLLLSWKEIAGYLNCNRRTCSRWEKELGLPIHRVGDSSKSSVFAYIDEIDKWLEEKSNSKSRFQKESSNKSIKQVGFFAFFLLIVIGVSAYIWLIKPVESTQPDDFQIEETQLIVLSKEGKEIWRYNTELNNLSEESEYREHFQRKYYDNSTSITFLPFLKIIDLNKDGLNEVLFSTQTIDQFNEGELICFNNKGTLLWKIQTGRELKFGSINYSPDFRIEGIGAEDLDDDGNLEVLIISAHNDDFPTQILLINFEGQILGEYWNSGRVEDFVSVELDNDGIKEIAFVGMNNEYKKACLIVFNPLKISGASPQTGHFKCESLASGTEQYYILVPRTDADLISYKYETIPRIALLKNNRLSVLTKKSKIYFEFNLDLKILDIRFSHTFERLHQEAFKSGMITSTINDKYRNNLAANVLYWDGKNWFFHPTMNSYWKNQEKTSHN